jgi:hypothetical protein
MKNCRQTVRDSRDKTMGSLIIAFEPPGGRPVSVATLANPHLLRLAGFHCGSGAVGSGTRRGRPHDGTPPGRGS